MKRFRCGDVIPGCTQVMVGTETEVHLALSLAGSAVPSNVEVPGPFPVQKA